MSLTDRQNELLEYLKQHKHARITKLAQILFASESTIRRDIAELKKLGLIERTYGGAVVLDTANEVSIDVRYDISRAEKQEVADIAKNKLPEFKTVFIDNSSTSLILAQLLNLQNKTVITNGLSLTAELIKRANVTVLLPGGTLFNKTNSLSGSYTLRNLSDMYFDLLLCSCAAINEKGIFENSLEQSEIKRMARKNCTTSVLLVDKTKIGETATYRTCSIEDFDLVFTNADDELILPYRSAKTTRIINKNY